MSNDNLKVVNRGSLGMTVSFDDEDNIPSSNAVIQPKVNLQSLNNNPNNTKPISNSIIKRESRIIKGAGIIAFKVLNRGCSFTYTNEEVTNSLRQLYGSQNMYGNVQAFKQEKLSGTGNKVERYPEEIKRINSIKTEIDNLVKKYALESITIDGFAICSASNFTMAKAEILLKMDERDKAVEIFISKLPELIKKDKEKLDKSASGGKNAFDPSVYKTPDQYREMYKCSISHFIVSNEQFTPEENIGVIKETQFAKYTLVFDLLKQAKQSMEEYRNGTKEKFTVNVLSNIITAINNNCNQQIVSDPEFEKYCNDCKEMITFMKDHVDSFRGKENAKHLNTALETIEESTETLIGLMDSFA